MAFTKEQLERYSRQIVMKEIGVDGQEKLAEAKVLIIGAGGLGSPAALYLAAAGIGKIGIADSDIVGLSNLQRQLMHTTSDLGRPKVESAKETLQQINPDVSIQTYNEFISSDNIAGIIADYDFVLDCTDNFEAKFLINDACVIADKPFTHAGVTGFQGQLMTVIPHETSCYRCIFQAPPPEGAVPSCAEAGIIGAAAGVVGSLQALEAIKYITGAGDLLTGKLLTFDALTMKFRTVKLPPRGSGCAVCADRF